MFQQHKEVVAHANTILEDVYDRLKRQVGLVPRFGVLDLEPSSVYDQVCAYRYLKKFEKPNKEGDAQKIERCYSDWLSVDDELATINFDRIPNHLKSVLYKARVLLNEWCGSFKPTPIIEFTPGESYNSNRGMTSVIRKLACPNQWTVTYDAFDDYAAMVYNNTGLKRAARRLMKPLTSGEAKILYASCDNPFEAFKTRLLGIVDLVHGSRLSSVPKNNEKRRAINVEPTGNMLLQRTVAHSLRSILASVGNDLELGQQVHRSRISDPSVATVDFSSASDRISVDIVNRMFPSTVTRLIRRWRSSMCLVDDCYYLPHKFSSMGCGFTFEIMTMLLLSIARVLDPRATVYGDDVIISNDSAALFCEVCESFGMKVNADKSFIKTPFRESCGAYYMEGVGYITSYDFHWCDTWFDVTVTANKLLRLLRDHPTKEGTVYELLSEAHGRLLSLAPALTRGYPSLNVSSGYIHDDRGGLVRESKADVQCKKLHSHVSPVTLSAIDHYCLPRTFKVVKLTVFQPKTGWRVDRTFRDQGPKYLASLLNGTLAHDTIRGEGEWVEKLAITLPCGGVWLFSNLKEIKWG